MRCSTGTSFIRARYAVDDTGLEVALTAWNEGEGAAPYGVGQHSCFTARTGTPYDFREPRAIAVEPMSCPPNAFADVSVVALEPGEHHTMRRGVTPWRG
ncbi:hypothetical protein ABZ871_23275 [Streptomyces populi]